MHSKQATQAYKQALRFEITLKFVNKIELFKSKSCNFYATQIEETDIEMDKTDVEIDKNEIEMDKTKTEIDKTEIEMDKT